MPRIASYVRLRGSETTEFEKKDIGFYELGDGLACTPKQGGCGGGDETGVRHAAELNNHKSGHEQHQKQLEDVNRAYDRAPSQLNQNGYHDSLNVTIPKGCGAANVKASLEHLKDDARDGRSGELKRDGSCRDHGLDGTAPNLSVSPSGRWLGGANEGQQHKLETTMSDRWEQNVRRSHNNNNTNCGSLTEEPSQAAGQWAASIHRVASYQEVLQQKQQQQGDQQIPATICTMHSACSNEQNRAPSQRFSRQQTARFTDKERENSSPARRARFSEEEKDESPPRRFQRQQTARYSDWERKASANGVEPRVLPPAPAVSAMVQHNRSPSEKLVRSQRSFSMRETPTARSDPAHDQAPRRKSSAVTPVKPRVSFSDAKSEGDSSDVPPPRIHEKWKDSPSALRQARFLTATTQSLRYNYEQPGFVERRSTDGCGKSYSNGGGYRQQDQQYEKENQQQQARQPPLSRTFSTFSFADKATYRRMARTFTFSTTKQHVQPVVVECVTCGRGLGIVVQGLPPGETSSFCKACKPGLPGAISGPGPIGTGEFYFPDKSTSRSSSVRSYSKKKKGMLEYCRRLFGMSRRYHNK